MWRYAWPMLKPILLTNKPAFSSADMGWCIFKAKLWMLSTALWRRTVFPCGGTALCKLERKSSTDPSSSLWEISWGLSSCSLPRLLLRSLHLAFSLLPSSPLCANSSKFELGRTSSYSEGSFLSYPSFPLSWGEGERDIRANYFGDTAAFQD